ncbi:hypothetical protein H0H93_000509 [Arthromyces matolae]|nr:hypothetical protein H0H93_000509 [Arthromyces matolae]
MVIGANTGIGFEATKHFARMKPARLILACRSKEKGEAAIQRIQKETGYRAAELWIVDLSVFSSVIAFADAVEKDGGRLDIVVANAGIASLAYSVTTDGYESTLNVSPQTSSQLPLIIPYRFPAAPSNAQNSERLHVASETRFRDERAPF